MAGRRSQMGSEPVPDFFVFREGLSRIFHVIEWRKIGSSALTPYEGDAMASWESENEHRVLMESPLHSVLLDGSASHAIPRLPVRPRHVQVPAEAVLPPQRLVHQS